MKILDLTLTAKEPLVITSGSAESMAHDCLQYIPGSMLLGAFATAWLRGHPDVKPDQSAEFQRLFLNGDVSWGCAFPLCGQASSVPVPLCYRREKSMGGLPVYGQPFMPDRFAVFNPLPLMEDEDDDRLAHYWNSRYGAGGQQAKFKKPAALFMDPERLCQPDLHKVWNIRVALGQQRSALESQLFGFSALAPGTRFRSSIQCRTADAAASLASLCAGLDSIRVGHARSAGYGLAAIQMSWQEQAAPANLEGTGFDIYLLSHYLPDPPWQQPLENLRAAMAELAGQWPKLAKTFLAYNQIEGFNSHWKRPRDSRLSLAQGSVLRLRFPTAVTLPRQLTLGADQLEGYGRIMVNPGFLSQVLPPIAPCEPAASTPSFVPSAALEAPFWHILRARGIERAARKQALLWLENIKWQDFLKDAEQLEHPTASQRANLMLMTPADFEAMLGKTPGRQWQAAVTSDPFGQAGAEHLDVIVRKLLQLETFLDSFPCEPMLVLPGGEPTDRERCLHASKSYAIFKRELVRAWSKNARIRKMEGNQR